MTPALAAATETDLTEAQVYILGRIAELEAEFAALAIKTRRTSDSVKKATRRK